MIYRALFAVVVVGCGEPAPRPLAPAAPLLEPAVPATAPQPAPTDADALRTLRALGIHSANADDILDHLDAATRHRYELAVLHDTEHLSCPRMSRPPHCALDSVPYTSNMRVTYDAKFDDPCFRRDLALRAMDEMTRDDVLAMSDAGIAAVVSVKPPDELLAQYLLGHVQRLAPEHLLAGLIAAHDADIGANDMTPHSELRPEDLAEAQRHHIYGAIEQYPELSQRATMIALLGDALAPPSVRDGVMFQLLQTLPASTVPQGVRAALEVAAADADCHLAGHAAFALAVHGDHAFDLRRPKTRAVDANGRFVCRALGELLARAGDDVRPVAAALHAIEDPRGMTLVLSGGGEAPRTMPLTSAMLMSGAVPETSDMLEGLIALLATCRGTHCASHESTAELTFSAAPDGGAYLSRIEVTTYTGSCGDGGA